MEQIEYVLITEDGRVASVTSVPIGDNHRIHYESDEYELVVAQAKEVADSENWNEWVYDRETGTFRHDPIVEEIGYTDLATGEKVSMTESEFNEMVDEKVRNNVVAILHEIMDADEELARKILNP